MKKLVIVLIFLLPASLYSQPSCTVSEIALTTAAVTTAIANNPDGSVICLAAGTVGTSVLALDITAGATKAVEIRGHGSFVAPWGSAGETIIQVESAGGAFGSYEVSGSSNYPTISNIRFVIDGNSNISQGVAANSAAAGIGKPWILHHNDFFVTDNCNGRMIGIATNHAVIYRNKFTSDAADCPGGFTNLNALIPVWGGNDIYGVWESSSTFGSADTTGEGNVYFETNYVTGFLVADVTSAARVVFRYNEFHSSAIGSHGFDSNPVGLRHTEFYGNTWYCDNAVNDSVDMQQFISQRGGTFLIWNNTFPATDLMYCNAGGGSVGAVQTGYYRAYECLNKAGWPGSYPDTYPTAHLPGWGYITGSTTVGATTAQGLPGSGEWGNGYVQDLEPIYFFNNINNTGTGLFDVVGFNLSECRAMAYSNQSKANSGSIVIPNAGANPPSLYYNVGQVVVVVMADQIGGTAPGISDDLGNTWTACEGGSNSGLRLSCWWSKITTGGGATITVTHDVSSSARAVMAVVMRGMTASPKDANPTVTNDDANPYNATASGGLSQSNEIILGYFALAGPPTDTIAAGTNYAVAVSCGQSQCPDRYNEGIQGTTGGTDATIAVVYRGVSSTSSDTPQLTNTTMDRSGIGGTISFKVSGSDLFSLDLDGDSLMQSDREYYLQASGIQTTNSSPFNGTTGTGWGTFANRPMTCTAGVAYMATDEGEWNSLQAGNDGKFYYCSATDTWVARYGKSSTNTDGLPRGYPHSLATVISSSASSHRMRRFH